MNKKPVCVVGLYHNNTTKNQKKHKVCLTNFCILSIFNNVYIY